MSSSIMITTSLFISSFLLLVHSTTAADPLFHFCSSSQNFTSNDPYEHNLNNLLGDLYLRTPPTGFGSGSSGQPPSRSFGLALCRGDVSTRDCESCIAGAGAELRQRCPYNKGSVIWYDNCLLKYSDEDFLGRIDTGNRFYMWNLRNVSEPEVFNGEVRELLSGLSDEAQVSPRLYATGESKMGSGKLYGLVQCTRDVSSGDCKRCLDSAISELPNCCDGKEGGRVVGGTCNFRYEIYPFVNA